MLSFTDKLERTIELPQLPRRIISVVPSQTELLFDLGLSDEVVGITKFCVHPEEWFRSKPRVGGTKQLKIDIIEQLRPDLVIANLEENVKEQIEAIEKFCPVWISDVKNFEEATAMIKNVGEVVGKGNEALKIAENITSAFSQARFNSSPACYLIWNDPMMTVGGDTFISDMMNKAGFTNVFADLNRYPEVTDEMIKDSAAEYLLISSEPFPFKEKHLARFQERFPKLKVMLVDGEMFSWYGSRMMKAKPYFDYLFNR